MSNYMEPDSKHNYVVFTGKGMNSDSIIEYCLKQYSGIVLRESWGERGIFYNPNDSLKRGVYVLTVKEKDGANDKGSMLS